MLTGECWTDVPTIKNAIRKRIDGLNPAVPTPGQEISVQEVRVTFCPDKCARRAAGRCKSACVSETKLVLCVDIDGVPYVLPFQLPIEPVIPHYKARRDLTHADLLNVIDRMANDVNLVAGIQRREKALTGEDAPMSQAELDARIARSIRNNPLGVVA